MNRKTWENMFISLIEFDEKIIQDSFDEIIQSHKAIFKAIDELDKRNDFIKTAHKSLSKKDGVLDFSVSQKNVEFQYQLGVYEHEYLANMQRMTINKLFNDIEDAILGCSRLYDSFMALDMVPKTFKNIEIPRIEQGNAIYFGKLSPLFKNILTLFKALCACLVIFKKRINSYHKEVDKEMFVSQIKLELAGQWNKLTIDYNRQINILEYVITFHKALTGTILEEVGSFDQLIVNRTQLRMKESQLITSPASTMGKPSDSSSDDEISKTEMKRMDSNLQLMKIYRSKNKISMARKIRKSMLDNGVILPNKTVVEAQSKSETSSDMTEQLIEDTGSSQQDVTEVIATVIEEVDKTASSDQEDDVDEQVIEDDNSSSHSKDDNDGKNENESDHDDNTENENDLTTDDT